MEEDQLEEMQNIESEKKHTKYRFKEMKIQEDIYSLAYAALINPDCLDYTKEEKDSKDYLPDLNLTRRERSGLFQSALMVVCI